MRPELLHLSGPWRGRTIVYDGKRWLIGADPSADVRYADLPGVMSRHAEIEFFEDGCAFHLRAIDGEVFVNQNQVREVILEAGDLVEIGADGPKFRFRVHYDPGAVCKPVRQMLGDAHDVRRHTDVVGFAKSFVRDLFLHATWKLKVFFPIFVAAFAFGAAYLGGFFAGREIEKKEELRRREDVRVRGEDMARIQSEIEEFRRREAGRASLEEVAKLREELSRHAGVVDKLADRDRALKSVLEESSLSVCLLYGVYTLVEEIDGLAVPLKDADGSALEIEYFGSGFMVSEKGHVITNRHVAEPWWQDDSVGAMIRRGLKPRLLRLDACFPERDPVGADLDSIRLAADEMDVAVVRVPIEGIKPLKLFGGDPKSLRGEHIVLVGYPTGINAVLARAEQNIVTRIVNAAQTTAELVRSLATERLITPVITQGALNEVKEKRLVYDAETTHGGSGGPVFGPSGEVIGVNFAITKDFGGSNFGIPIAVSAALLK